MKIRAIARTTYSGAVRQPIFYILVLLSLALILLSFSFTLFTFSDEGKVKMIRDMGLATITVCALLVALFSASTVIADEVEKKTVLTVLCKPVSKVEFIVGKYLGIMSAVMVAVVVLTVAFLIAMGVAQKRFDGLILAGVLFSVLQVTVLTAVSVAVSTRFPMTVNVPFCIVLYGLGHLSNYLREVVSGADALVRSVASVLLVLVPNLENFSAAQGISDVPVQYLMLSVAYAAVYTCAALSVAVILFQTRELA